MIGKIKPDIIPMVAVPTTSGTGSEATAALSNLAKDIGLPVTLPEAGITTDMLDQLANDAINDVSHRANPVPVTQEDLMSLYKSAM